MKKFSNLFFLFLIFIFCCSYTFPDKVPDWKNINTYLPSKLEFKKSTVEDFLEICPGAEIYNLENDIKIISSIPDEPNIFREVNAGFRNGTLDWLEFILNKEIQMSEVITLYGFPRFIDSEYSDEIDYYNYDNFNVSTDKDHAIAKSITIFDITDSAYYSKLAESEQNKFFEVFSWLKPGFTSEETFLQEYPDLLPYMERDFDVNTSYTLVEELGGAKHNYKKAVIRFENGLLSWINLVPVNPELNAILKKTKSEPKIEKLNKDYDFYTFDNFVLVVSRKYKRINSIGIVNYDDRF